MQHQETVYFVEAEFDELPHDTVFCKLADLQYIVTTLRKELKSALVASEFQRRNKVGCAKLDYVMQVVLTRKTHDTIKNRLYISLWLFENLTYFSV